MIKKITSIIIAVTLLLIIALPVMADAIYKGTLRITNSSGSPVVDAAANFTLNSTAFLASGDTLPDFSNVSIQYNGVQMPFMPGIGPTSPWWVFVPLIPAGNNIDYSLYAKGATGGKIRYFPGNAGMTIADSASMNITNQFQFLISDCYVNTVAGAGKNIFYKNGACSLSVSETVTGNITFSIVGGASVSATSIPSGEYDIEVTANVTDLMIFINSVPKGTTGFTNDVPWNSNAWMFFSGNTTMYVGSLVLNK